MARGKGQVKLPQACTASKGPIWQAGRRSANLSGCWQPLFLGCSPGSHLWASSSLNVCSLLPTSHFPPPTSCLPCVPPNCNSHVHTRTHTQNRTRYKFCPQVWRVQRPGVGQQRGHLRDQQGRGGLHAQPPVPAGKGATRTLARARWHALACVPCSDVWGGRCCFVDSLQQATPA